MLHPRKRLRTCPWSGRWVPTKRTSTVVGKAGRWDRSSHSQLAAWASLSPDPCHLKGREPGSLLECGKLKTMLPNLACLISRGPGHTAQPRPPSQPSLSSVLTACRHLCSDHDQPVELLHLKGQWRGLGSESLRQACGVPPAQSKSGGGSPKPEVT